MALLEIDGILNGKRLRKCSPNAHWRYGYYLMLTNGYARIEMDFEAISYRLISFRGTAPTAQDIENEFSEYEANHLIFVYEVNGQKWAQFDTSNSGMKEWKTSVDLKSPMPPDEKYCDWLKEQHGEHWKKFHWFNPAQKTKGIRQVPNWFSPSIVKESDKPLPLVDQDLAKSSPSPDQDLGLGLGLGLGSKNQNIQPDEPLGEDKEDFRPSECTTIIRKSLGVSGQSSWITATEAIEAHMAANPQSTAKQSAEEIARLWPVYRASPQYKKFPMNPKTWLSTGEFLRSENWSRDGTARGDRGYIPLKKGAT